jgi:hypothetical protein
MKNLKNILIDIVIFIAFLLAMEPKITGETIHEWFSLALAGTIVVHLLLHWDWIVNVGKKYFAKLWHSSRLNFFLDMLMFIAFNSIIFSGIMISKSVLPSLGISVGQGGSWKMIHKTATEITLWLFAAHVGLHWRWIWSMAKQYIGRPVSRLFTKKGTVVPVTIDIENRLSGRNH